MPTRKLIVGYGSASARPTATTSWRTLPSRLTNRVQLRRTTFKLYLNAVDYAFGVDIDFACWKSIRASARRLAAVPLHPRQDYER